MRKEEYEAMGCKAAEAEGMGWNDEVADVWAGPGEA